VYYDELKINLNHEIVSLQGKDSTVGAVRYFKQGIQPNIITLISLSLETGSWYNSTTTVDSNNNNNNNATLSRNQLLHVLANRIDMTITASAMSSSDFGYIVRIGKIRYKIFLVDNTSIPTTHGETEVVEQCRCPIGYTGASCQHCMEGYYHHLIANSHEVGGFRECRKCECHGHSSICNKQTGECINCQHNTVGHQCELCKPGYYGNATNLFISNSCTKCPCQAPNTQSDVCVQDSLSGNITCTGCSTGYRGALCERCERGFFREQSANGDEICTGCRCNNNTDMCNEIDGYCSDCGFNTTGRYCDVCLHGWYGDAKNKTCNCK